MFMFTACVWSAGVYKRYVSELQSHTVISAGLFLLCVVVMYVLWLQVLDVVDVYINHQRSALCPDFQLTLSYGLSFMFAPIGIFFCLLAGLLFLLIGRTIQIHYQ